MNSVRSSASCLALTAALLCPAFLAAAPAHDSFASATVLGPALPATSATTNALGATYETGEPVLDSLTWNGSLWFKWVPTATGTGYAQPVFTWEQDGAGDVNGSGFEMIVHKGTSLTGLTPVARGSDGLPIERFAFSTSQTYYIQVFVATGAWATSFPSKLVLSSTTASPTAPANDSFASPTTFTAVPQSKIGTTAGATIESSESIDSYRARSVWFKYTNGTTALTRAFTLTTAIADSYPTLEIFTGTNLENLVRVGRVDAGGEGLIPLLANTSYYLRVFNNDTFSVAGTFSLAIATLPTGSVPGNNNFASATNLGSALDTPTAGNTFKSGVETTERTPFGTSGTVWFKWTAPAAGWYSLSADSAVWPPALAVWSGTTLSNLKLRTAADSYTAYVEFHANAGELLYFQACDDGGYAYAFTLTVSAATAPLTPRLASLALSPASVIVSSTGASVTATLTVEGPADGIIDSVYLLHPNGGVVDYALTDDLVQTSGTPGNGTFTATLTVPQGVAAGSYPLVVYLTDSLGDTYWTYGSTNLITPQSPTYSWWDHFDIPSGPDSLTVTNSGAADTAPTLFSFILSPTSVDVGTGAATFTLTAGILDDDSVPFASLDWNDPTGVLAGGTVDLVRTAGTPQNGSWTGSFTIPRYTAPGQINLTLQAWDSVGQSRRFGLQPPASALQDKFDGRLQMAPNPFVTLTNTVGLDVLPPQVSEVTLTPNPATFGTGGSVVVAISARVKDSLSGTSTVTFSLDSGATVALSRSSGTAFDGVYTGTLTVLRTESDPGLHDTFFQTVDVTGNEGLLTSILPDIPLLTLLPQPGTYEAWAAGFGLVAPDDDPAAEPKDDGIPNALKFACNLDPTQAATGAGRYLVPTTGTAGLPSVVRIGSGAAARLRVEFIRRTNAPGLAYFIEFCSDPGAALPDGWVTATGGTVIGTFGEWERVQVEDTAGTGLPRRFARLRVEVTP